ncbi:MAG: Col-0 casein kinase I [Trebouxia sp. A1-2]|nr:MAG: Col-0 casein kinase I [Trebouxia sp. A1-2]
MPGLRPTLVDYGMQHHGNKYYSFMVLEQLGPNLADLLKTCGGTFTIATTLKLAIQLLTETERFHECCFVHGELKPDNVLMGLGSEADKLFLIDLALSRKYKNPNTHEHVPYRENVSVVGNPIFASNDKLTGTQLSRRDDLASISLMLVYFLKGSLPWSDIFMSIGRNSARHWFQRVKDCKLRSSPERLCDGLPKPILNLMTHASSLPFAAKPDYETMRQIFQDCFCQQGLSDETFQYDWIETVKPANIPPSTQGSTAEPDMDKQQAETHSQLKGKHLSAVESNQPSPKRQCADQLQLTPAPGDIAMDASHSTDTSNVPLQQQPEAAEARHTAAESPSKADADPAALI